MTKNIFYATMTLIAGFVLLKFTHSLGVIWSIFVIVFVALALAYFSAKDFAKASKFKKFSIICCIIGVIWIFGFIGAATLGLAFHHPNLVIK